MVLPKANKWSGAFMCSLVVTLTIFLVCFLVSPALTAENPSAPIITDFSPKNGAVPGESKATISFTVTDPDRVSMLNYYIKLNGLTIPAKFQYKGHLEYDDFGDPYWVIDSYEEATISAEVNCKDGVQQVDVYVEDQFGNGSNLSWNFTVAEDPKFTNMSPLNFNTAIVNNYIFVQVTDNDEIDPTSITLAIDDPGNLLPVTYDDQTGNISCLVPPPGMANGNHIVYVKARDKAGNEGTASWTFYVQKLGEAISFSDADRTFTTQQPELKVELKSNARINSAGTQMQLDGKIVMPFATYKGHLDYNSEGEPEWVIESYNEAFISYNPYSLDDGRHQLSVTLVDEFNNSINKSWEFKVAVKPVITGVYPEVNATIDTTTTTLKALIYDRNNTEINKDSIKMLLDGKEIYPSISKDQYGYYVLNYPVNSLAPDIYHRVDISVDDTSFPPNTGSFSWGFHVNPRGEMAVSPQGCGSCHQLNDYQKYQHSEGPLGVSVVNPYPTHDFSDTRRCNHCHANYREQSCGYCHNGVIVATENGGKVSNPDPAIAAGQDCLYCHSKNNGGWIPSPPLYTTLHFYMVKNMVNTKIEPIVPHYPDLEYTVRHDILPQHLQEMGNCNSCHSKYLTREHNRQNKQGVQMTCQTCHSSTDPKVKEAILAKNRDCSGCHVGIHASDHDSKLDLQCQSCHNPILDIEHISGTAVSGKGYNCSTCHSSTNLDVKLALATKSLSCSSCHLQFHNIPFGTSVPVDIPLLSGFTWSRPIGTDFIIGEITMPIGYEAGKYVISNRQNDITSDVVWNYYQQQLTNNGWVLNTQPPNIGDQSFTAEYQKGQRYLFIKNIYKEEAPIGYRIELWYK